MDLDFIENPELFKATDDIVVPFMKELQDKTVTLLLENLEARRLQTQPQVSNV